MKPRKTSVRVTDKMRLAFLLLPDSYMEPQRDENGRWLGWCAACRNAPSFCALTKKAALDKAVRYYHKHPNG